MRTFLLLSCLSRVGTSTRRGWSVVENQTETGELSSFLGKKWNAQPGSGVQRDVEEALDTELDAYLDRELSVQPAPEVKPSPVSEKPAERLQSVLSLAAEEEQWLRTLPPPEAPAASSIELDSGACPIPEHLKPASEVEPTPPVEVPRMEAPWVPPPAPLPGLATVPHHLAQPGWSPPVAPVPAPIAPHRTLWIVTGVLVGVSIASLLVAGMLWMVRSSLPDRTQEVATNVPTGAVTAVQPAAVAPAPKSVLSVKDSPLPRQSEPLVADWHAAPEPAAIAHAAPEPSQPTEATGDKAPPVARSSEPHVATTKTETVKPSEKAQVRRAPAAQERRDIEDSSLEDTQRGTPFTQQPAAATAPAPVAKAAPRPAAPPETSDDDESDKEFARKLGLTQEAVRKEPEPKAVKSVWIPPDPGQEVPESLTPQDIQSVVVANRAAIASCIRRGKDASPGLRGGKFLMRWSVYPNGSTYGVAMETQELRGTALATCLEGLVKDWKFPKHRTQMGPIRFPFIF